MKNSERMYLWWEFYMQLKLGVECLVESFRDGGGFDRVPRLDRSFIVPIAVASAVYSGTSKLTLTWLCTPRW